MGLELGGPANQNVFIGSETAPGHFDLLPFFDESAGEEEAMRYDAESSAENAPSGAVGPYVGQDENGPPLRAVKLRALAESEFSRELKLGSDIWRAPGFDFAIYSPCAPVPNPVAAPTAELQAALVPAVLCELSVDNSDGTERRRAVFGFSGNDLYSGMRRLDDTSGGECAL